MNVKLDPVATPDKATLQPETLPKVPLTTKAETAGVEPQLPGTGWKPACTSLSEPDDNAGVNGTNAASKPTIKRSGRFGLAPPN